MKELFKDTVKITYKHKKGNTYVCLGTIKNPEEASKEYVLYMNSDGMKFVRECKEFHDGRFIKSGEDRTEYSITDICRLVMPNNRPLRGEPSVLYFTQFDVIDATNGSSDRKVCLAWYDCGPVFMLTKEYVFRMLKQNMLASELNISSPEDALKSCVCHKLGEYYCGRDGMESIFPLCCINHGEAPDVFMRTDVKLYNFCPTCGKELIVMRTTVKSGDRFMSVFWDENLTEG